jgi:hypothetical protein
MRERALEKYQEDDSRMVDERRRRWERTLTAERLNAAERQRRKKLRASLKPKHLASKHEDPFLLAQTAVRAIQQAKRKFKGNPSAQTMLCEAEEAIKRLAWGPSKNGSEG